MKNIQQLTPREIRHLIRKGKWDKPTSGLANGLCSGQPGHPPAEICL